MGIQTEKHVFVAEVTLGERAKFERLLRNWRQIDLASAAKVQVTDVIALEKDRWLPRRRKARLLEALGLEENVGGNRND